MHQIEGMEFGEMGGRDSRSFELVAGEDLSVSKKWRRGCDEMKKKVHNVMQLFLDGL